MVVILLSNTVIAEGEFQDSEDNISSLSNYEELMDELEGMSIAAVFKDLSKASKLSIKYTPKQIIPSNESLRSRILSGIRTRDKSEIEVLEIDDKMEFSASVDELIIQLDSTTNKATIESVVLSRNIGAAEHVIGQEYMSIVYDYTNGKGSDLERTDTRLGESGELEDGVMHLVFQPATDLNPYVMVSITNKDGSTYTIGMNYNDCVVSAM